MNVQDVPIVKISVGSNRRGASKGRVKTIADSIMSVGLLHPIGLTPDFSLIYGRHRLEAYSLLGWKTIPAVIHDHDELHTQLAVIDENLIRHQLTALQESQALKRRKEIYEALHPETKHGGAPGKAGGGKQAKGDKVSSFADDTAAKTGKSSRTVKRAVAVAEKLPPDVQVAIADTPIANNRSQLQRLSKLDEPERDAVVEKIVAGEADSVQGALDLMEPEEGVDAEAHLEALASDMASRVRTTISKWSQEDPATDQLDVAAMLRDLAAEYEE